LSFAELPAAAVVGTEEGSGAVNDDEGVPVFTVRRGREGGRGGREGRGGKGEAENTINKKGAREEGKGRTYLIIAEAIFNNSICCSELCARANATLSNTVSTSNPYLSAIATNRCGRNVPSVSIYIAFPSPPP
jgi:hypothetical protein